MRKGRGKGKISNDLVAASCAAVLAVYAAGFTRTREAARRFEPHVRQRRPAAAREAADSGPTPVVMQVPVSAPPPPTEPSSPVAAHTVGHKTARHPVIVTVTHQSPVTPPGTAADASAPGAESSSMSAPRAIAPVPLPAPDTDVAKPIAIRRGPVPPIAPKWRDGTYTGVGESAHGDIEARVVIKDGRIVEAGIATCDTRYPCDVIGPLIHQPVERQSPDVDYMSHATESSDAYYDALVAALDQAVERPADQATVPK